MGEALIAGLIAAGRSPTTIIASHPREARRREIAERHGIEVLADNLAAARQANVVVFAVKPQILPDAVRPLADALAGRLAVSVAAGVSLATLGAMAPGARLVRAMPNQPASVRAGITGLFAGPGITEAERQLVESIFEAVGACVWLAKEDLFHALTALAASGPAFVYVVAEALADGGVAAGLPRALARTLAAFTVGGAGRLLERGDSPADLKDRVASPAGTTIHGLAALERGRVRAGFIDAVRAAADRSRELAGAPAKKTATRRKAKR